MNIKHSSVILTAILILLLPLALFVIFWMNIFWSILLSGFLIYLLKDFVPKIKVNFTEKVSIKLPYALATMILVTAWILYGGIGKIGYQNFDYVKHNSIFFDLLNSAWPVQTSIESTTYHLVYYLGYYIVPAAIGKIFNSLFVLEIVSILQAFIAINTLLLLITIFSNKKNIFLIMIVFIFWGGLDIFGNIFFKQDYSKKFGEFPEWWAGASNFQYTGFTDLLYWVPQHALGGWLVTALSLLFLQRNKLIFLPFIISLSLIWSPFACMGLLPFLLTAFLMQNNIKQKLEWCFTRYGIFALSFLVILMGYYTTSDFVQPFKWQYLKMGAEEFIPRYFIFLALETLIPICFIFYFRNQLSKELKIFFYIMIVFLFITPHIYLGVYSDFAMRASIPGLFTLFVLVLFTFPTTVSNKKIAIFAILYITCTSYSAISDFYRAQELKHIELGYGPTKVFDPEGISMQYLGLKDRLFFKIFFEN